MTHLQLNSMPYVLIKIKISWILILKYLKHALGRNSFVSYNTNAMIIRANMIFHILSYADLVLTLFILASVKRWPYWFSSTDSMSPWKFFLCYLSWIDQWKGYMRTLLLTKWLGKILVTPQHIWTWFVPSQTFLSLYWYTHVAYLFCLHCSKNVTRIVDFLLRDNQKRLLFCWVRH